MKLIEAIQKDFKHNGKLYKWIPKDDIRVLRKNYWNDKKWQKSLNDQGGRESPKTNLESAKWLAKQIKSGKIEKIGGIIVKNRRGKFVIKNGFHRFAAMMWLGYDKVPIHEI